ncbi:MAG: hypothetical protein JW894_10475 [Bacteroidales bacterium]|nr:hypothetical protein [Bacteroidales bacterium]
MKNVILFTAAILIIFNGCKKDNNPPDGPYAETLGFERVGFTSAYCKVYSEIKNDTTIAETGVCWSTSDSPTLQDNYSDEFFCYPDSSVGKVFISDLEGNTTYNVRAYSIDQSGNTGYGKQMSFTTLNKEPVTILFEYNYYNVAWGFKYEGFYIDNSGNIWGYDLELYGSEYGIFPGDGINNISQEEAEGYFYLSDTLYGQIDIEDLNSMTAVIDELLEGTIETVSGQGCADFGFNTFFAYYLDTENDIYTRIIIEQSGDWCRRNSCEVTPVISDKLYEISRDIFPYFGANCNCGFYE